jgi:hypothetical protein
MAFTHAERAARYRAAHPERIEAYQKSERHRALSRAATARWRARNPKEKKPLPVPVDLTFDPIAGRNAAHVRKHKALSKGYAVCTDYPPPPADSICQCCGRAAKLHLDHDHETGKFRGYICIACNMGIGQLGDTESALFRALLYLRRRLS